MTNHKFFLSYSMAYSMAYSGGLASLLALLICSSAFADGGLNVTVEGKTGGSDTGLVGGLSVGLVHKPSGTQLSLEALGGSNGTRVRGLANTPDIPIGDAFGDVDAADGVAGGGVVTFRPLTLDGFVTTTKDSSRKLQANKGRAIASTDIGVNLVGVAAKFDPWSATGQVSAGGLRASVGAAGGVINSASDGLAAVAGPIARLAATYAYMNINGNGVSGELGTSYILNLANGSRDVFGIAGAVDYLHQLDSQGTVVLKVGPEASYDTTAVKPDSGNSTSCGQSFYAGGHVGLAF